MSKGCWDASRQLVKVSQQRGVDFKSIGFRTKEGLFLHPEEALYLLTKQSIAIYSGQRILSVLEGFAVLLPSISIDYFRAYQKLKSCGKAVKRAKECDFEYKEADNTVVKVKVINAADDSLNALEQVEQELLFAIVADDVTFFKASKFPIETEEASKKKIKST